MKTKVFIDGSEGTTGLRIHERFQTREDIELITIDPELRKDPCERKKKINESDITFLCPTCLCTMCCRGINDSYRVILNK